jgi:Fis family transcriptional regulator
MASETQDRRALATPSRPLEAEIRERVARFFEMLGDVPAGRSVYRTVMAEVERPLIEAALERTRGVRSDAARALGIDRGTLSRRMRALGIR